MGFPRAMAFRLPARSDCSPLDLSSFFDRLAAPKRECSGSVLIYALFSSLIDANTLAEISEVVVMQAVRDADPLQFSL